MNANELKQTVADLVDVLAGAIDDNNASVMRSYLEFTARFHNYSVNNQLLIYFQRPDATQVAGYKAWQKLGRQVRKGEKGIAILVPMTYKVKDDNGGDDITKLWFGTGYVFDASQTDGDPLPEQPNWSSTECAPELQAKLLAFAESLGIQVEVHEISSGAKGTSSGGKIVLTPDTGTSTLVHELAHELLHQQGEEKCSREVREWQAETTAAVVMSHFGFQVSESLNYLGFWNANGDGIKANLTAIQKAACKIIEAVES